MATSPLRFAVVGLGHVAQVAVLPAFKHAEDCELSAFVTGDERTACEVAAMYGVSRLVPYDEFDQFMTSGEIDAVYITLPNSMHCEYAVRALEGGVHVICEKPMAVTEADCKKMISAAKASGAKLMAAYRLHFEEANLEAIEIVRRGSLGEARVFTSCFTLPVKEGNIRVKRDMGGGTLYDIGVYCINAARSLFQDEPIEVSAASFGSRGLADEAVEEAMSVILRFPGERLAAFTCSFGVEGFSSYRIAGTKGDLRLEPAFNYVGPIKHFLTIDGKTAEREFTSKDQFAPLLIEMARCIREDRRPGPDGVEGLADVRVIEAAYKSAQRGRPVKLRAISKSLRTDRAQAISRPPVKRPRLVNVESATTTDAPIAKPL